MWVSTLWSKKSLDFFSISGIITIKMRCFEIWCQRMFTAFKHMYKLIRQLHLMSYHLYHSSHFWKLYHSNVQTSHHRSCITNVCYINIPQFDSINPPLNKVNFTKITFRGKKLGCDTYTWLIYQISQTFTW